MCRATGNVGEDRNGVGDAIFGHRVVVLAPSAWTLPTVHYFRAIAMEREWWG